MLLFDCLVIIVSNLVVYTLTHGGFATSLAFRRLVPTLLIYLIPYIIGFRILHTYSGVIRYSSFSDLETIGGEGVSVGVEYCTGGKHSGRIVSR